MKVSPFSSRVLVTSSPSLDPNAVPAVDAPVLARLMSPERFKTTERTRDTNSLSSGLAGGVQLLFIVTSFNVILSEQGGFFF